MNRILIRRLAVAALWTGLAATAQAQTKAPAAAAKPPVAKAAAVPAVAATPAVADEAPTTAARPVARRKVTVGERIAATPDWLDLLKANLPRGEGEREELGREIEEPLKAPTASLFDNPAGRRALGENPRFIYQINSDDPMVVPWVRLASIFRDLDKLAQLLLKADRLGEARQIYMMMMDLPDPGIVQHAQLGLQSVAKRESELTAMTGAAAQLERVELPVWVKDNLSGTLVGPDGRMALLGEFLLREGDALPNYPEIKVGKIGDKKVEFLLRGQTFEVDLRPGQ